MKKLEPYTGRSYDLFGLSGISDHSLAVHFGLYEVMSRRRIRFGTAYVT